MKYIRTKEGISRAIMEQISYWKNGRLIIKKFRSREEIEHFVHRKGITQYYLWGYCFMEV